MKHEVLNQVLWGGLSGRSLDRLIDAGGDAGVLRPILFENKCYIAIKDDDGKTKMHRIQNTSYALPYETWLEIDQMVTRAAQSRLKAVADLKAAGLTRYITNGFSVMALMNQTASRVGTAKVGMDPTEKGPTDKPIVTTTLLPLPCIWADASIGARELAVSKRGGLPLDTAEMEDAARACAETAEKMLIGNSDYDQYNYAGGTIYGYTDHGSRNTWTVTAPTTSGWVGSTLLGELLAARQDLIGDKKYGPYVVYMAPAWAKYLDNDYLSTTAGQTTTITIRERILKVGGFSEIRELDYLTGWTILIVQMESETVREVIGMDWTTVQWEEQGGQVLNWKVMGIYVPQIRADYDGNCGISVGTV